MKVSASILVAAAIGASAHPNGGHVRFHHARDYVVAKQPTTTTTAAAYVAAAATSSAAASSTPSSSSSSDYIEFCSGSSNSKRATTAEIASVGNLGTESDYGCNMMSVTKSIVSQYDYTITFNNDVDEDQACVCWNKIGPDRKSINGFWKGNEALNFTLPASGSAYVALEANSQGGCACTVGDTPATSSIGQYASTWVEFDFCSTSNSGWSGADASSLVALDGSLHVPALKVCSKSSDVCSTITTGSGGSNAYNTLDTVTADGIGLNLNTDTVHLICTVGE